MHEVREVTMAIKPSKTLRKIKDTSKTLRKVKLNHDAIAKALGATEHFPVTKLSPKETQKIVFLLKNPPKPGRRLKDVVKRYDEQMLSLPLAPEVCILCRDRVVKNRHIMHVIDELGDLHISMGEDGKHFLIEGSASAGDLFWLRRILQLSYAAVAEVAGYGDKG
jgi:hypothetical protein